MVNMLAVGEGMQGIPNYFSVTLSWTNKETTEMYKYALNNFQAFLKKNAKRDDIFRHIVFF